MRSARLSVSPQAPPACAPADSDAGTGPSSITNESRPQDLDPTSRRPTGNHHGERARPRSLRRRLHRARESMACRRGRLPKERGHHRDVSERRPCRAQGGDRLGATRRCTGRAKRNVAPIPHSAAWARPVIVVRDKIIVTVKDAEKNATSTVPPRRSRAAGRRPHLIALHHCPRVKCAVPLIINY